MLTDTHCIVIASARTGGPSSAGSITQTRASTARTTPTNQSPDRIHPARPASGTSFVMCKWPLRVCFLSRKHRPPASFELWARAVVVGSSRGGQAVLARGGAAIGDRSKVAEAVEQPLEIGRRAHEPGVLVIDHLGQPTSREGHDRQSDVARLEDHVAKRFF